MEETLDRAISWHIRIGAPDASDADWSEFTAWLEADPANRMAFDSIEDLDLELDAVRLAGAFAAEGQAANVRPIRSERVAARGVRVAGTWLAGAALLAASLIVFYVFQGGGGATPTTYATYVGETKVVNLSDGTRIDLNTATTLSVQVDETGRQVTLDRGEALFHVAKDASHPFVVTVGDRKVRVVGTVFDILRSDGAITIVVAEGRVAVSPRAGDAGGQDSTLGPGDQLVFAEANGATSTERIDPAQALAWRQGYLVYRNAPLSKVVNDLNRYFAVPVILEGDSAAQRFTGVLRIDEQTAVLRRISQLLPVTVQYRRDGKISLRASPAKP